MDESIFKVVNAHFSYLNRFSALCGIDMEVRKGEKIAILGANGSGKSTLLQLLDALLFPNKGDIFAFGRQLLEADFNDPEFCRKFRSKVGLVFQNPDIQLFCPTVKEDIYFGPLQLGIEKNEAGKRIEKIAGDLGIGGLLDRAPHQLSVGEKRKVAIATVLVIEPEIILLDEPTAGLDPQTSRRIIDIIIEANEHGRTIVTATHDLHVVEEIADRVYILNREKQVAKSGPAQELLSDTELLREHNLTHMHKHRHNGQTHIHPHQHLDHHQH
ncbi:MAG: ABC transporter ATP-binding protein [Candidatus Omnitrophica bacterium]|nr:ABC transporter ATP-binding protein [Candidatus Omnitrophota bacterium]